MNLATISHDDLHAVSVGRATVLAIIIHSPAREDIPAPVMDDLTDWVREPVDEAVARADALLAQYRLAVGGFDPAPDDLADKSIAAMRAEIKNGSQS